MPSNQFQSFASGLLVLVGAIFGSAETISAAPLYWDTNGSTLYPSGSAPSGVWDSATANWSTSAAGNLAPTIYVTGSSVIFAAGTGANGTYTVTLNTGQSATGLDFQEGHVTLAPLNAPTVADSSGVQILTLTGTAPVVNVQNMDSVIQTKITASGLTKTGVGKLTLNYGPSGAGSYYNLAGAPLTINAGTVELAGSGSSANQLNTANIVINSGATFLWSSGVNNIADGALFTVNTGGSLIAKVNDQIGSLTGNGFVSLQNGALNFAPGNTVNTFSGLITGNGTLQANSGNGTLTLANANTFTGTISSFSTNTGTGGIRLGHARAAQNATLNLVNTTVTAMNVSFSTGIGTFIVGGLQGTSNLALQDTGGNAITLQVGNNDLPTTYKGVLTGSGGLTKIGTGILTLTGETSGASTYTGDTTVNGAAHNATGASISSATASTLKVDFSPAGGLTADIVNASSRLVLGGGRLWVAGDNAAGVATSQTFNGTKLTAGRSYATVTLGTNSADTVLNLGAIDRTGGAGSILEFTLPAGVASLTNGITTTTANDASGILGGWAVTGTDWAVKNTAGATIGNVVAASAGVYTSYTSGDLAGSATANLLINNAVDTLTTGAGTTDLNTLMVRNNTAVPTTVNRTIDIAAGETLRLGVAGAIWNQGTGTLAIGTAANVGTLTAGGADNTAGELILNNGGGDFTIRSSIKDNGGGTVTVVKTGSANTVILSGTNTYSGGTIINQGRLRVDSTGGLGSGAVTVLAGGQLWINVNAVFAADISLAGSGYGEASIPGAIRMATGTLGTAASVIRLTGDARIGSANGGTGTLAGKITGDYALDIAGGGSGTGVFTLTNTANDFTGNFSLNTNLNATSAFNNAAIIVKLGAAGVIPNGVGKGNVVLSAGTGAVTLDLNGFDETINSLTSQGTSANIFVTNSKANSLATLTIGDNNATTLVAVNTAFTTAFGGAIVDTGTGRVALTKIGEGTQTLTGANTYSGPTTISKGILQAGAANALSANSAVVIASDPTAMLALTNGLADFSQTVASLSGGGTVNLGTIVAADATKLTVGDATSTTYSGVIVGGGGLVKQGAGVLTLTGTNTYLGSTTVNNGTLLVHGALTGTSAVNVTAGTFGGNGTVTAPVSVAAGASLQGGDGGTAGDNLAIDGDVSLAGNAVIKLTLGAGLTHSTLTRDGGSWVFNSDQLFTFTGTGFTIGTYDNIITGLTGGESWLADLSGWQITNAGVTGTFAKDASNNIDLTITAVPEPGALLSLGGGLALLLGLRRRRR